MHSSITVERVAPLAGPARRLWIAAGLSRVRLSGVSDCTYSDASHVSARSAATGRSAPRCTGRRRPNPAPALGRGARSTPRPSSASSSPRARRSCGPVTSG